MKSLTQNETILEKIKETIYGWNYKSEYDLESIRNDLRGIVEEVTSQHFKNRIDKEIHKSVSW